MSEIIKMDYGAMEDMAQTFRESGQTLEDIMHEMESVAASMEGGALLGRGGQAWVSAIRERLIRTRLQKLTDKMNELSMDIYGALVDLRDGDHESQSRFKG
ncbi:MAG TPA: WXG100 family type VII secretion target [Anaerolineales bacterium]|jgi:WXG100 family type VII secretion target|nr:WXG100 family type VII secretion target [Anaerolineales bacterium]